MDCAQRIAEVSRLQSVPLMSTVDDFHIVPLSGTKSCPRCASVEEVPGIATGMAFSAHGNISAITPPQTPQKRMKIEHTSSLDLRMSVAKPEKPKIGGGSFISSFTPDQIIKHISSLKDHMKQQNETNEGENKCTLCGKGSLYFQPSPKFCEYCCGLIKPNAKYYSLRSMDHEPKFYCDKCKKKQTSKADMETKINNGTEEEWVQCSECATWQHQICALFSMSRSKYGEGEYTCPCCLLQKAKMGELHLPYHKIFGAKELPTTKLSNHLEERLLLRLMEERGARAKALGKKFSEVPAAEGLVLREVSSLNRNLEVNKLFRGIFEDDHYPAQFPYKSKAILLFQKIDGADVCLFAMYVQEFGSQCAKPNQRRVFISYIDSVKHFTPEITAVTGEALRTFVYHEILIAYLDYCKKRGFASCHIWVFPPAKQNDYILYCHPHTQKTPKSQKLREWYLSMIHKATKEDIVVDHTNLYDHFFVATGECKAEVTAARLPYFDGDFWPRQAQVLLQPQQKVGNAAPTEASNSGRALRAERRFGETENAKDFLFMQQLGESIRPAKEAFIIVQLQHSCNHCHQHILSGFRCICNVCKKFQLCQKCHNKNWSLDWKYRHPAKDMKKHSFSKVAVENLTAVTDDDEEFLQSNLFDTRITFLGFCQNNCYQFDTLRHAKHSSMMILHHLHSATNPNYSSSSTTFANKEYCHESEGGVPHDPHGCENNHTVNHDVQDHQTKEKLQMQGFNMHDLVLHSSMCRIRNCTYQNCRKVRGLFHHGIECKLGFRESCMLCEKMWHVLLLHAMDCKETKCPVPRCRDLKNLMKNDGTQQSDGKTAE